MPKPPGLDPRIALLNAWALRCELRQTDPRHCAGPEAFYLVTAVEAAVRRGRETPHLGRAARSWGSRFTSPGEVVAALSALREVLMHQDTAGTAAAGAAGAGAGAPAATERVHLVLDQLMANAVDAAASTLRDAARTDPLTRCANRRALDEELSRAASSAGTSGLDLAVAAVDVDGLKRINDTSGHAAGDAAILGVVGSIRQTLRQADTLYRTGGDEFVVLAPFTDAAGATELMTRAETLGGPPFSWGVASLVSAGVSPGDDPTVVLGAADADLYRRRGTARRARRAGIARRRSGAAVAVAPPDRSGGTEPLRVQ